VGGIRHTRRGRRRTALVVVALVLSAGTSVAGLALRPAPAFADSGPYEYFCPNSAVGSVVMNDVVTTGTLSPPSPGAGEHFSLTGYRTKVVLPAQIVSAALVLGNAVIRGTAQTKVEATGATPTQMASGAVSFSLPIPSPVPPGGLVINLPAAPSTLGPFTASGGPITMTADPSAQLNINVSGSGLALACTAYPNGSAPTGITSTAPPGSQVNPVIATTSASGAASPSSAPASGGAAPASGGAPSAATSPASGTGALATTGPGKYLWLIGLIGFVLVCLGSGLVAVSDDPPWLRRTDLSRWPARRGVPDLRPAAVPEAATTPAFGSPAVRAPAFVPAGTPAGPARAARHGAAPPGLWRDSGLWRAGWEPRTRSG